MTSSIPLAAPSFDDSEERAVLDVVRSRWLTMGPRVAEFEAAFARTCGVEHAVMTSSCTSALHLAFAGLGIGPGEEVVVPSLTFVATANAVTYTGAEVRFADITSLDRPVIDVEAVRALINPATAAVCVVHFAGYPADMEGLGELCRENGLALIEDAAHAPGATVAGRQVGSIGDVGCFSFFSNKNLVTGEGGMVTTDDGDLAARIRTMRAHGLTATTWDRDRGHASGYDVIERGYNYRPSEIEAALGLVQLGKLAGLTERRRELAGRYRGLVPPGCSIPFDGEDASSSCHIMPLVCPSEAARDRVREAAGGRDIQTSIHYPPIHRFSTFAPQPALPITEEWSRREVTLPLYPDMADDDVDTVASVAAEALVSA